MSTKAVFEIPNFYFANTNQTQILYDFAFKSKKFSLTTRIFNLINQTKLESDLFLNTRNLQNKLLNPIKNSQRFFL